MASTRRALRIEAASAWKSEWAASTHENSLRRLWKEPSKTPMQLYIQQDNSQLIAKRRYTLEFSMFYTAEQRADIPFEYKQIIIYIHKIPLFTPPHHC